MLKSNFFFGHNSAVAGEATATPGVGLVTTVGQIPDEYRELNQGVGVGLVSTTGQIPVVAGFVFPDVGLVSTVGQIPGEYRELNQGVGVGLAVIGGLAPSLLQDGAIGPTQGLTILEGRVPSLYTELVITPPVGLAILEGRGPTISTGDVVEATATPGVGLVTLSGTEPTLAVEYDKPRGHVIRKRRRSSKIYQYDLSESAAVSVPEIAMQPVQIVELEPEPIAAIDTSETEAKITLLETRRSRIARMRREEEELIAILLRAA